MKNEIISKIVNLDNKSRKGEYIYITDGKTKRYYKTTKNNKDVESFFINKYIKKTTESNINNYISGKDIFSKFKKGENINRDDILKLKDYVNTINTTKTIKRTDILKEWVDVTGQKPLKFKNKLRDDKGKPIRLKNNKYKVVSREKNNFIPSQFVCVFEIKFNIGNMKRPNYIKKTITGYLDMSYSFSKFDKSVLISMSYEKALNVFIAKSGFKEGSDGIKRRIKDIKLIDSFWISYVDYGTLLNEKISKIYN